VGERERLKRCGNMTSKKEDLKADGPYEMGGINCNIRKALSVI